MRTGASGLWLWNRDRDRDQDRDWDQQLRSSARLPLPVGVEPLLKVGARGRRFLLTGCAGTLGLRAELDQTELNRTGGTDEVEPGRDQPN